MPTTWCSGRRDPTAFELGLRSRAVARSGAMRAFYPIAPRGSRIPGAHDVDGRFEGRAGAIDRPPGSPRPGLRGAACLSPEWRTDPGVAGARDMGHHPAMPLTIRPETPEDTAAIERVTRDAFRASPHGDGGEAEIVAQLRSSAALVLSLVAEDGGRVVGHVAFSPVTISDGTAGWLGLGPVSVDPREQGRGVGAALIRTGLARLREAGAAGCVLVGEPSYYSRFGFAVDPRLTFPGVPPEYFQVLAFSASMPVGTVAYAGAFTLDRDR